MKKLLLFAAAALCLAGCNQNEPTKGVEPSNQLSGSYIHSGTVNSNYSVSDIVTGEELNNYNRESSFDAKNITINIDNKVVVSDVYGTSSVSLSNYYLFISSKDTTIEDDGSIYKQGIVFDVTITHAKAKIYNDSITWTTYSSMVGNDVEQKTMIMINSSIENCAIKQ